MDWEVPFTLGGQIAACGWLILILAPRRWPLLNAVPRFVLPGVLSLGYAVLILVHFGRADGGFGSLADVKALLSSDPVLLAGWIHYLAFDLFIGGWIAARSDRLGVSRLVQAPVLAATFLFGPFGLLCHLLLTSAMRAAGHARPLEA